MLLKQYWIKIRQYENSRKNIIQIGEYIMI